MQSTTTMQHTPTHVGGNIIAQQQQSDLQQRYDALLQQCNNLQMLVQQKPVGQPIVNAPPPPPPLPQVPVYTPLSPNCQLPDPSQEGAVAQFMSNATSPMLQQFLPALPAIPLYTGVQTTTPAGTVRHATYTQPAITQHQPTQKLMPPPPPPLPQPAPPPPPPPLPQDNFQRQSLSSAEVSVQEGCGAYGRGTAQPHSYDRDCGVEGYPDARIATSKCMQADAVTCKFDVKAPPPPPLPPKPPGTFTSPPDSDDDDRPYELVPFKMK